MSVKNIITIQHPESVHHTNGMIGSWTDWDLSEKGKNQAQQIAQKLRKEVEAKDVVLYTSPLKRTLQTAEAINKLFHTKLRVCEALKERNLGKAVGKSVEWLKNNIENEEVTVYDKCFSDAESRYEVWQRLHSFFEAIMKSENENIIIVSHGDTLSIWNAMWLGLDPAVLNRIDLYGMSGGVSFLHQTAFGKRIIKRLSDMSFL